MTKTKPRILQRTCGWVVDWPGSEWVHCDTWADAIYVLDRFLRAAGCSRVR